MFMRATKQVAVCGAVAGGLLVASAAFGGYRGTILTTLVAMVSAVLLALLAGFVNGRRIYARQLNCKHHVGTGSSNVGHQYNEDRFHPRGHAVAKNTFDAKRSVP